MTKSSLRLVLEGLSVWYCRFNRCGQRIPDRISLAAMSPESKITVTGHTDDVPISNAQFRDNGIGRCRAASVDRLYSVQDQSTATACPLRVKAKPVADNATASGREQNRRIEIEIIIRANF